MRETGLLERQTEGRKREQTPVRRDRRETGCRKVKKRNRSKTYAICMQTTAGDMRETG